MISLSYLILEAVSGDEIYHYTYPNAITNIIKSNRINMSSNLGGGADKFGNKVFFLSLSRTKSLKQGFISGREEPIRIVFDSRKLNNRFKSMPVDYWRDKDRTWGKFEFEDRLLSDKPYMDDVNKYIIRIEGVVIPENSNMAKNAADLIKAADSLNIPIAIYANEKDLTLKRNPINDKILKFAVEKDGNTRDDSRPYERDNILQNVLAIVLYDPYYLAPSGGIDKLCADIEAYKKKNGINTEVSCSSVYDKIRGLQFNSYDIKVGFKSSLHNLFKSGRDSESREHILLLTKEMKKLGVSSIDDLYKIKIEGLRPTPEKKDYSSKFALYELNSEGGWDVLDNSTPIKDLYYIRFTTYKYGGYFSADDMSVYFSLQGDNEPVGKWINYVLSVYTVDKAKELIRNSGYSEEKKRFEWKLDRL